jgi:hypothetical protein
LVQGLPADLAVLSDDAGQFNVFAHVLCWIHAERAIAQLLPLTDSDRRAIVDPRRSWATLSRHLR